MRTIGLLSVISLAMVFAILYSRYRSVLFVAIIMASVPLALIGSVTALWIADQRFRGLNDRLHHADRHFDPQRYPQDQPLHQSGNPGGSAVRQGSRGAGLARTPDARLDDGPVGGRRPHSADDRLPRHRARKILHPVAITIFGGLVTATVLDTLLTPTLFLNTAAIHWSASSSRLAVRRVVRNKSAGTPNRTIEAF